MSAVGAGGAALITGATGQDGHYLSQLLQRTGFGVDAVPRDVLTDIAAMTGLPATVKPDVVFHLAAVSSVAASWRDPTESSRVNASSTTVLLDACLATQDRIGKAISPYGAAKASASPRHPPAHVTGALRSVTRP